MRAVHYKLKHFIMQHTGRGADVGPQINKSRHCTLNETDFDFCFVLSLN